MSVFDFFNTYFLIPIQTDSGYNVVNTVVYAVIAVILLYGIYKLFEKLKVPVDINFFYSLLPFVVFGSSMRAFVDHELMPYNFWFVSPGIYLLTAAIFLGIFFLSYLVEKFTRVKSWKRVLIAGILLDAIIWFYAIANGLQFQNLTYVLAIIGLAVLISAVLYFVFKRFKFTDSVSFLPFPAHMLDASATFIAVDFLGFTEKHPLPATAASFIGTAAVMYLLKLIVLIPVVYYIRKEIKDRNFANYLLIAIAVLGLAEGLRDILTLCIVL